MKDQRVRERAQGGLGVHYSGLSVCAGLEDTYCRLEHVEAGGDDVAGVVELEPRVAGHEVAVYQRLDGLLDACPRVQGVRVEDTLQPCKVLVEGRGRVLRQQAQAVAVASARVCEAR